MPAKQERKKEAKTKLISPVSFCPSEKKDLLPALRWRLRLRCWKEVALNTRVFFSTVLLNLPSGLRTPAGHCPSSFLQSFFLICLGESVQFLLSAICHLCSFSWNCWMTSNPHLLSLTLFLLDLRERDSHLLATGCYWPLDAPVMLYPVAPVSLPFGLWQLRCLLAFHSLAWTILFPSSHPLPHVCVFPWFVS